PSSRPNWKALTPPSNTWWRLQQSRPAGIGTLPGSARIPHSPPRIEEAESGVAVRRLSKKLLVAAKIAG
ncbi:hypothetical protein BLA29_011369, partial [Euroglyphus maynei]